MSAGSPQASWSAAMNRPSERSHRYGPLGPSQKPVLFVDQPQGAADLALHGAGHALAALAERVRFPGEIAEVARPVPDSVRVVQVVDDPWPGRSTCCQTTGSVSGLAMPLSQPVQEPPEDPKGPDLHAVRPEQRFHVASSGRMEPLGPPSVPVDVEAEDVLDAEGTVVVEQSVDRVVLDCPFDRAADSVRPDADEEARPLRRSGEPCGSQPTAAGAVGKWSAASVVRRACINTVHDLPVLPRLTESARGYGRTTGGGDGQQIIEIVSRAGEGKHTRHRRHVRTLSRRLSPLRRQGRLSGNAVRPRAGSGTTTVDLPGPCPGSVHDTGPDGRGAARSWAGRSTSVNAEPVAAGADRRGGTWCPPPVACGSTPGPGRVARRPPAVRAQRRTPRGRAPGRWTSGSRVPSILNRSR